MTNTANLNEIKALVVKSLESNGMLAQIRAQLRASVYQALNNNNRHEDTPEASKPQKLAFGSLGLLSAEVILDFFEFHGLQHSLAVFQTEAQLFERRRRPQGEVAADAGVGTALDTDKGSILEQLIGHQQEHKLANAVLQDAAGTVAAELPSRASISAPQVAVVEALSAHRGAATMHVAFPPLEGVHSMSSAEEAERPTTHFNIGTSTIDKEVRKSASLASTMTVAGDGDHGSNSDEEICTEVAEEALESSASEDSMNMNIGYADPKVMQVSQISAEQSLVSLFDSPIGPDKSVDSMELENCDYFETVMQA